MRRRRGASGALAVWVRAPAMRALAVGQVLAVALALALPAAGPAAAAAAETAPNPSFDQAFSTAGEPAFLHYHAEYRDRLGHRHHLKVWRDHDQRIRRLTDDRLDVIARRQGGEGDIAFTVIDRQRQTATRIDRVNLMRLGLFVDWQAQGHGLLRPAGAARLLALPLDTVQPPPDRPCTAWRSTPPPPVAATDICWDETLKLPIWMRDADGHIVWRLLAHDLQPIADAVFAAEADGISPTDLNAEFGPSAD